MLSVVCMFQGMTRRLLGFTAHYEMTVTLNVKG